MMRMIFMIFMSFEGIQATYLENQQLKNDKFYMHGTRAIIQDVCWAQGPDSHGGALGQYCQMCVYGAAHFR